MKVKMIFEVQNMIHFIQLFRGRLWDKVCATTPKGTEGGFEFTVFQRIDRMTGEAMDICL